MQTAIVSVQYINPPQQGRKNGNIKTDSGDYYGVPPAMLGQFSKGGKYEIAYESREYNGKTYHTVKTVKALGGAAPSNGGGGVDDSAKSENIFVCGAVNALLSGMTPADVTPESIALLTNNLRMGWRRGLVPASKPASSGMAPKREPDPLGDDDMDGDQIPF